MPLVSKPFQVGRGEGVMMAAILFHSSRAAMGPGRRVCRTGRPAGRIGTDGGCRGARMLGRKRFAGRRRGGLVGKTPGSGCVVSMTARHPAVTSQGRVLRGYNRVNR
jgi:hypothetical protein